MPSIRLVRPTLNMGVRGPGRGSFALHFALRVADLPWLHLGGQLQDDEIPWVWSWQDKSLAVHCEQIHRPYIIGPNVLYDNSSLPGCARHEPELMKGRHCALMFTESPWYARLLRATTWNKQVPIAIFSYPIDPQPEGPLPAKYDLLIYLKDKSLGRLAMEILDVWRNSNIVVYGAYDREEMVELARQSRAGCYLSSDDRGPLALAEIMLAGCPAVGIERGAPWVLEQGLGVQVKELTKLLLCESVERAMMLNRDDVRETALQRFSTEKTVNDIRVALEPIACPQVRKAA